jgi:hypothetical protein
MQGPRKSRAYETGRGGKGGGGGAAAAAGGGGGGGGGGGVPVSAPPPATAASIALLTGSSGKPRSAPPKGLPQLGNVFAVIADDKSDTRSYPWGAAGVYDRAHSDLPRLQDLLFQVRPRVQHPQRRSTTAL